MPRLYDQDFNLWAKETAAALVHAVAEIYELPTPPDCPWTVDEILG
jgi:hypothetical protein